MKRIEMYSKIQELKEQGFTKNKTAKLLGINRATVKRYWNMSADDYEQHRHSIRKSSVLDKHRAIIECWLKRYPCISSAQICDWLKENYSENFKERTVSRYVKNLREQLGIKNVTLQENIQPLMNYLRESRLRLISAKCQCLTLTEKVIQK